MEWYWWLLVLHCILMVFIYIYAINFTITTEKKYYLKWWEWVIIWTMPILWELWWIIITIRDKRKVKVV